MSQIKIPSCICCFILALAACTTTPASENEQSSSALLEGFSSEAQEVGSPADGLTLRSIRSETHDGFVRFVFDLEGDSLPFTRAAMRQGEPVIDVAIHGVRMDQTGNRPLMNEAGEPFGSPVAVDIEPIRSYGRMLVLDDSLIAYEFRLSSPSAFKLHSEGSSTLILDISR